MHNFKNVKNIYTAIYRIRSNLVADKKKSEIPNATTIRNEKSQKLYPLRRIKKEKSSKCAIFATKLGRTKIKSKFLGY